MLILEMLVQFIDTLLINTATFHKKELSISISCS